MSRCVLGMYTQTELTYKYLIEAVKAGDSEIPNQQVIRIENNYIAPIFTKMQYE